MSLFWLIFAICYTIIVVIHLGYLYSVAKSIGYAKDPGRLTFISLASLFWFITWIIFLIDSLRRGRK
jgi:hypothetical protein